LRSDETSITKIQPFIPKSSNNPIYSYKTTWKLLKKAIVIIGGTSWNWPFRRPKALEKEKSANLFFSGLWMKGGGLAAGRIAADQSKSNPMDNPVEMPRKKEGIGKTKAIATWPWRNVGVSNGLYRCSRRKRKKFWTPAVPLHAN